MMFHRRGRRGAQSKAMSVLHMAVRELFISTGLSAFTAKKIFSGSLCETLRPLRCNLVINPFTGSVR